MGAAVAGLVSCRGGAPPDGTIPRARIDLTFDPLTSEGALMSPHPVRTSSWGIPAGVARPPGLTIVAHKDYETSVTVVTAGAPQGVPVPVDPGTTDVLVDPTPELVTVVAGRVDGPRMVHDVFTSNELSTWQSASLGDSVGVPILRIAGGLAFLDGDGAAIDVVEFGADGTVDPRGTVTVPEGESWEVLAVGRHDQKVLVACSAPGRSPFTVASTDTGATWSGPVELPHAGEKPAPSSIAVQGDTFVVIGSVDVDPEAIEGTVTSTHLTAWSTTDLAEYVVEAVPLPTGSWEGFVEADGTPVDPTPFELVAEDYARGRPGLSADGSRLEVPRYWLDSADVVERGPDGSWHLSDRQVVIAQFVREVVEGPDGFVIATDDGVVIRPHVGDRTIQGMRTSPRRATGGTGSFGPIAGGGISSWRVSSIDRDGPSATWENRTEFSFFAVHDDRLVARTDMPSGRSSLWEALLIVAEDGREALMIEPRDAATSVEYLGARGWSRDGDAWTEMSGLPAEGSFEPRSFRWTGEQYVLAGGTSVDRERSSGSVWSGRVWTSPDAASWSEVPGLPERSQVADVLEHDGVLWAAGSVEDESGTTRAAVFQGRPDGWDVTPLDEGSTSWIGSLGMIGGVLTAFGRIDGEAAAWSVPAEGTPESIYRAEDSQSRGTVTDLGSGCLLASGWTSDPEVGRGGVVWASGDGGKTWDASPVPGDHGRGDSIDLERDGDDVIVLVSTPDGPRAYRIRSAVQDIQGTSAPAAGSDGGGG